MKGTLNDTEIINSAHNGELIVENFVKSNVKQACYELRAGDTYFDLTAGGTRHTVNDGESILFKPHQTIAIISKEKFNIPNDVIARFLTKGTLFSVGFTPVNTYADPGFFGRMGIVMTNASNNYLKINSGDVIAKVEFDRLETAVNMPYKGQHGFETGIWPIRTDYIVNPKDLPKYNELDEIENIYGESVANVMRRILITERRFVYATIVLIIINLIVIGLSFGTQWISPVMNVILGIISNLCYAIVSFILNNTKLRKKNK